MQYEKAEFMDARGSTIYNVSGNQIVVNGPLYDITIIMSDRTIILITICYCIVLGLKWFLGVWKGVSFSFRR